MRIRADVVGDREPDGAASLPSPAEVDTAVAALTLLADPTRLRLLWLLSTAERDVGTMADLVGTTPAATSQHLGKLRLAGLVSARQEGRHRVYATRGGHVARLVQEALYYASHRISGEPDHG